MDARVRPRGPLDIHFLMTLCILGRHRPGFDESGKDVAFDRLDVRLVGLAIRQPIVLFDSRV